MADPILPIKSAGQSPDAPELGKLPLPGEEAAYERGDPRNMIEADRVLKLSEPERALYVRHLHNLWEDRGYSHSDGSVSTLFASTVERDGKHFLVPTVSGGRIHDVDDAVRMLEEMRGFDDLPSYGSEQEARERYEKIHEYMDRDVEEWGARSRFGGLGRATAEDARAISKMESGGRYDAVGPDAGNGHRAYGKYQVMDYNIPVWTREVLGRSLTPEEFLGSRSAQDEVFAVKFGQYKDMYGEEGAARAWFGGPGAARRGSGDSRRDALGTSVEGYGKKFTSLMNRE